MQSTDAVIPKPGTPAGPPPNPQPGNPAGPPPRTLAGPPPNPQPGIPGGPPPKTPVGVPPKSPPFDYAQAIQDALRDASASSSGPVNTVIGGPGIEVLDEELIPPWMFNPSLDIPSWYPEESQDAGRDAEDRDAGEPGTRAVVPEPGDAAGRDAGEPSPKRRRP